MKETHFIQQNKQKWNEFEHKFANEKDPEKVSNLFIQITDDLSYSRTYYPNRSVKIYLNNLAQKVFHSIYRNRVRRRKKFASYWKEELPRYLYEARWQLLLAFSLFMVSFFIGMFSSMHDSEFARFILGNSYVSMTEENIRSGDPMKVYKEMNQMDMFFGITINNLMVAFITLVLGVFFGVGTAYLIITNGVMIGVFQYFFIERDLFWESFLTIWVHGALEVSAIVIAGGAGFTIGKGFLFPGTFKRMQSFRLHGIRAIQIFLGIAPIIVLAGINESFLTRYTETPDFVRAILISIEFAFMLFYFVIYPLRKAKAGFKIKQRSDEIPPDKTPEFNLAKIKTGGEVFSDCFMILKQFSGPILLTVFGVSVLYTGCYFWLAGNIGSTFHNVVVLSDIGQMIQVIFLIVPETFRDLFTLLGEKGNYNLAIINAVSLWLILSLCAFIIDEVKQNRLVFKSKQYFSFLFRRSWLILLISVLLQLLTMNSNNWLKVLMFVVFPYATLVIAGANYSGKFSLRAFGTFGYYIKYFMRFFLHYVTLLLLSLALSWIAHSVISLLNAELVKMNIPFSSRVYEAVSVLSITITFTFIIFLQICMITINMGLMYFSVKEIHTAVHLKERLQHIGNKKNKSLQTR